MGYGYRYGRTELVARRVSRWLRENGRMSKTIVFCTGVNHAERMRQHLANLNRDIGNVKYVMRITGDDPIGKKQLDNFIDVEQKYPVVATTSKLLSTGVDCKTCKLIVLDSNIQSMTEFKQIIGRGTRLLWDDDKRYFTIMDFRNTGRGMAIGKVSEKDALEVAMNSEFTGQVKIYAPDKDVADSGFIRMYRSDGSLAAFLATSDGGNGLNLHLYGDGAWTGALKIMQDGKIDANSIKFTNPLSVLFGGTDATDADGARANLVVPRKPKLLWSGSWSSGSITVPNFSNYKWFFVQTTDGDGAFCWVDFSLLLGGGLYPLTDTGGQMIYSIRAHVDDDTLTMENSYAILRPLNSLHGGQYTRTVKAIYGLLLNGDVLAEGA